MAATKLIAMHQNKGRSVMRCLKDRTDYAMNGEKTDEGKYISSYQCNPELVDLEFAQAKKEYLHKTWRQPKASNTGSKDFPRSERLYSTRGGISP